MGSLGAGQPYAKFLGVSRFKFENQIGANFTLSNSSAINGLYSSIGSSSSLGYQTLLILLLTILLYIFSTLVILSSLLI